MHSCIYEGRVTHRRFRPVKHQFQYRLFMVYVDLDELPELLTRRGPLTDRRLATASFLRRDHLQDSSGSLDQAIRNLVATRTGVRPGGPIRLLTQLRCFGYYFSPLNLFFCFDEDDGEVEFVVAEVSNTPWRERHCYFLWEGNRDGCDAALRFIHRKSFHVSPFMDMDADYRWQLSKPADSLNVSVTNTRRGEPFFTAALTMRRRPLTRRYLARSLIRYPIMTAQIVAAIYYQAIRLWMKKCPFYPHPKKRTAASKLPA